MLAKQDFLNTLENKEKSTDLIHSKTFTPDSVSELAKLAPVVETILSCRRQNIPLRDHRPESSHCVSVECESFQEILDFRVDNGDEVLQII